jgi:hypothetical protein
MIIAVLVLLGVDLWLVAAIGIAAFLRRRSVKGRRGAFKARIRVAEGELEGFSGKWKRGYGHWIRDVLVWNDAPFLFRTKLIPVDGTDASGIHGAQGTVKGLGKHPVVAPLVAGQRSRLELATSDEDRELGLGPFARTSAVGSLVLARDAGGELKEAHDN